MSSDTSKPRSRLLGPPADLNDLSFCAAQPEALNEWLAGLPRHDLGEAAQRLYRALLELNRLNAPPARCLALLECLRPNLYLVCRQLESQLLRHGITLDERARKIASLCQALQNHLATGYARCTYEADETIRDVRGQQQWRALAFQRALQSLRGPLVRAALLYCPAPEALWYDLHQLYQRAVDAGLQALPVTDELLSPARPSSVERAYGAALLFGCAGVNQLRQPAILQLASRLDAWSAALQLLPAGAAAGPFVVDREADAPPHAALRALMTGPSLPSLNTDPLLEAIRAQREDPAQNSLPDSEGVGDDLLRHLSFALDSRADRSFPRRPGEGQVELCIGMGALHLQLTGGVDFATLLKRPEQPKAAHYRLNNGPEDVWSTAFDVLGNSSDWMVPDERIEYAAPAARPEEQAPTAETHDSLPAPYQLAILDHSPGGYRLGWNGPIPEQLQAGELIGLRSSAEDPWSLGVVRWLRQVRGGYQMGVELIAPTASACGLQLMRKTEQRPQYVRALLLPAIPALSRPVTLIAPRLPFQEGHKVSINVRGEESRALLTRQLSATASFGLFEYRDLGPRTAATDTNADRITPARRSF